MYIRDLVAIDSEGIQYCAPCADSVEFEQELDFLSKTYPNGTPMVTRGTCNKCKELQLTYGD